MPKGVYPRCYTNIDATEMTVALVRELFDYDPEEGVLRWRISAGKAKAGNIAGRTSPRGYRKVTIYYHSYLEHRLAWLHYYGEWPKQQIDHINRNPSDNRISNLRDVSISDNALNRKRERYSNAKGVSFIKCKGRWRATLCLPTRTQKYIGSFVTEAEARAAYANAAARMLP